MYADFIRIKSLEGELKISLKKRDFGITISTSELVLQKPHVNYHIKLAEIISMTPYEPGGKKTMTLTHESSNQSEFTNVSLASKHYKFFVQGFTMHSRSGIKQMGQADFVMPVIDELLRIISEYSGLNKFV